MSDILSELNGKVLTITLNRINKHNAFDDTLLKDLLFTLEQAEENPNVCIIILQANGKHFSAGGDANWMQRMAHFSEAENIADAVVLARVMFALNQSSKTTIAAVQGAAFGGGAGLVAACDIAIAAHTASFAFPEVKLGLIPAVISPYVVNAIGSRAATWLFTSAEIISAQRALEIGLVQHQESEEELHSHVQNYAQSIAGLAPVAVADSKRLVQQVSHQPINEELLQLTAKLIAKKRVSAEGQRGLQAFINKEKPHWD